MKTISLSQGKIAKVDDEDFVRVSSRSWCFAETNGPGRTGYAHASVNGRTVSLHRFILKAPKGRVVDHINGDGLDNRRENLRLCSPHENSMKRKVQKNNTSGFRGVYWYKPLEKWKAAIMFNKRKIYLGVFSTRQEAAERYNRAALELFGNFACLNQV